MVSRFLIPAVHNNDTDLPVGLFLELVASECYHSFRSLNKFIHSYCRQTAEQIISTIIHSKNWSIQSARLDFGPETLSGTAQAPRDYQPHTIRAAQAARGHFG